MPTYDYECRSCKHRFEALQGIKDPALAICPACNQDSLKRLIGTGGAPIFKGSGFYQTDYKSTKTEPPRKDGAPS